MDQGYLFDAADEAADAANREVQERATRFIRWALENGGDSQDALAACFLTGVQWDDVKPQRQAA